MYEDKKIKITEVANKHSKLGKCQYRAWDSVASSWEHLTSFATSIKIRTIARLLWDPDCIRHVKLHRISLFSKSGLGVTWVLRVQGVVGLECQVCIWCNELRAAEVTVGWSCSDPSWCWWKMNQGVSTGWSTVGPRMLVSGLWLLSRERRWGSRLWSACLEKDSA